MTSGTGGPEFRPPNKERLSAWLAGQRWFGGKDRRFEVSSVQHLARLTDEPVASDIWLVEVTYDDGGQETYQVPLVRHHEWVQQLEHVHVADDNDARLYDALHDKSVTRAWLDGVRRAVDTPVVDERITFHALPEAAELPDASSLVMTAEQSNTSLVYGGKAILKVYRRIFPGPHPDIELHEVLTRAKSPYIAPLFGWVEGRWNEQGQEVSGALAMLQEFLPLATDGWQLALTSVLDLLGEEDLRADEVGGDFAAESERLGRATAHVHADIAEGLGTIGAILHHEDAQGRVGRNRIVGDRHDDHTPLNGRPGPMTERFSGKEQ